MKYSEAMLKGFMKVNGKQCKGLLYEGDDPINPPTVCVNGAANLGATGDALTWKPGLDADIEAFEAAWGLDTVRLNNDGLHWTEIYGMARAAGL